MKKAGIMASVFGIAMNFALFLAKLYVALSSNSLSIYCDSVNNLLDIFSCGIALLGFVLIHRLAEQQSLRAQSLCTFVISAIIALTGAYFLYNGIRRALYPVPISYSVQYAVMLAITIGVKAVMAVVYHLFYQKQHSNILSALVLDSVLDCGITVFTLIGLLLVQKVGFPLDGVFAIALGTAITVTAVKGMMRETKYIINN